KEPPSHTVVAARGHRLDPSQTVLSDCFRSHETLAYRLEAIAWMQMSPQLSPVFIRLVQRDVRIRETKGLHFSRKRCRALHRSLSYTQLFGNQPFRQSLRA